MQLIYYLKLVIILILFKMTITDLKVFEIKNSDQLLLLIFSMTIIILQQNYITLLIVISIFILLELLLRFKPMILTKIGGGDLKVLLMITLSFGQLITYILLIASSTAIVFSLLFKKNKIPFIPFITLGVIVCQILSK